jgi:hypothetical protein
MANISDAHGTFVLQGNWEPDHIKVWLYILHTQTTGDYAIYLDTSDFQKGLDQLLKDDHSMAFSAFGRWAFAGNLTSLQDWSRIDKERWDNEINIGLPMEYKIDYEDYLVLVDWLYKEMYSKELIVLWDYYDMEPGCDFMITVTGIHAVRLSQTEQDKYLLMYSEDVQDGWDCNLKNYCEHFTGGDYEALDELIVQVANLYALDKDKHQSIETLIKSHETWYDISVYPWYEKKMDLPSDLRYALLRRIKGVVPW